MKYRIVHDSYRDRFKVEVKGKLWGWNHLKYADDGCLSQPTYGFYRVGDAKEFLGKVLQADSKEKLKKSPNRYTVVEVV